MSHRNPFLFIYGGRPYRPNPFTALGVKPDETQATIDEFARAREQEVAAGVDDPALGLRQGDCIAAAQQLHDPVARLAYDLMLHWPEAEGGRPS